MRLPFKIVKNPPLKKIDRKLNLEEFYTFKNGHKIYTYKVEDLVHISGRYLDQIKSTINFMIQYNSSPEQVKLFAQKIMNFAKDAIDNKLDRTDALMKIYQHAEEMPKLSQYVDDIEQKMWYDLYVMFFVLSDEPECVFTPEANERKIKYLEQEGQEFQEKCFFFLKNYILSFSSIYREDMLSSLVTQAQQQELVDSITDPMRILSSLSKQPSTAE